MIELIQSVELNDVLIGVYLRCWPSLAFFLYEYAMIQHALMQQSLLITVVVTILTIFAFTFKHFVLVFIVTSLKHFCGLVNRKRFQNNLRIVLLLSMEACTNGPFDHVIGGKNGIKYVSSQADLFLHDFEQLLMICFDYF